MSTGVPKRVSVKRMESIFRHGEVAYATEFSITTQRDSDGKKQYQIEIRTLLSQNQ
jgi:hypothetical protein